MAELFGVTVPTINYHLDQIELSGEIHLSDGYRKYLCASDKWSGEVMSDFDRQLAMQSGGEKQDLSFQNHDNP